MDAISCRAVVENNHIINFMSTSNVNRGKIRGNGASAVAYETTSDRRLKEYVVEMNSMIGENIVVFSKFH